MGSDLAQRHALEVDTYDMYCGYTCSLVAVDVQATAAAFVRLFNSPELRAQMGEAGKARARAIYDWKPLIGQYEALWAGLREIRAAQAQDLRALAQPWPARMDPFVAFTSYPSQALAPDTVLALVDADLETALRRTSALRGLAMVSFAKQVLPTEAEIATVLSTAASGQSATAAALVQHIPAPRQAFVFRSLNWLLKLGILKIAASTMEN
jgi:hypothetical protein